MTKRVDGEINIGIDYSIQCPCICVHTKTDEGNWHFKNCQFFYLTDKKKYVINRDQFHSEFHREYKCNEERWFQIATWAMSIIYQYDPEDLRCITLEGYSYGSRIGQAFNIAENGGMLKHMLWNQGYGFDLLPPSTVKKFATDNGLASKLLMWESFFIDANFNLLKYLGTENPESNPASDIVDSYYVAKVGF